MPLNNCQINLFLTWSGFAISSEIGATKLKITNTKHYVPAVILPTQDNAIHTIHTITAIKIRF